jgi:uncharacterized protein with beta-barrel porin domain
MFPVSRQEMKAAKTALNRLSQQVHNAEKAAILKSAARIITDELDRLREPPLVYVGRTESNRQRH